MKIRRANPDFKKFEASEEDFSKKDVENCANTLIYILNSDSEALKSLQQTVPNLKEVINYVVKVLMCYEFKIKPSSIVIKNEEVNARTKKSNTAMSFGRVNRYWKNKGVYGFVNIYPIMQQTDNLIEYILCLLHEFRHLWQNVQKERGYFVLGFVDGYERVENDLDRLWEILRYSTNFNEFDANIFASSVLKKFMKRGETKKYLPKNEYKRVKSFVNVNIATTWITFVIGSIDRAFVGTLLLPYLIGKKISQKTGFQYPLNYCFDLVDECNKINEARGYRNKDKAQQYLRHSRVPRVLSEREKLRIIDSMLVVFATKHNINPASFGLLVTNAEKKGKGFVFVSKAESSGDENVFGYIVATKDDIRKYQGVEFFDKMVEYFADLEKNNDFVQALNDMKKDCDAVENDNIS